MSFESKERPKRRGSFIVGCDGTAVAVPID